jgi:predicted DNA-binding protein (MmcQ/YjbR family)
MTASDFRRIALSFPAAEESSHMGAADFRVGNRIFATLASVKDGYGNLMLSPELQADFLADAPEVFLPVKGGWGRMGATHLRLAQASQDTLAGALQAAYNLRVQKNTKATRAQRSPTPRTRTVRSPKPKA